MNLSMEEDPTTQPFQVIDIAHQIELPTDSAKRKSVYAFAANEKDRLRRYNLQKGPFQPNITFLWRQFENENRRFIFSWFKLEEHSTWFEYNISNDSAYFRSPGTKSCIRGCPHHFIQIGQFYPLTSIVVISISQKKKYKYLSFLIHQDPLRSMGHYMYWAMVNSKPQILISPGSS